MIDPQSHPVRLCVYGATAPTRSWLAKLRDQVDAGSPLVLLGGACDESLTVDAQHPDIDGSDPAGLSSALWSRYPHDDHAFVRSDSSLPAHALARLRHALHGSDALAVGGLDNLASSRSPLPVGASSDAEPDRIDALVLAYGEHRLVDSADVSALLSLWISGTERGARRRLASVDHVYVAANGQPLRGPKPGSDPRDPAPPSPLAPLRRRLLEALEADDLPPPYGVDGKPVLLHVMHGWGGGAQRWVDDMASAWEDIHHLVLIARGSSQRRIHGEWLELRDARGDAPPLLSVALPLPIADTAQHHAAWQSMFAAICRDYSVSAVMLSSLIGHSLDALRSGLPTLLMVHDHYPLWPLLHRDFGDPSLDFDAAQLKGDLKASSFEFVNRDPQHWQALRDAFVAAVGESKPTLVSPSRSALDNELKLAPEFAALDSHVIPHGLADWPKGTKALPPPPKRTRLRLVVVGRLRSGKGGELLAAALSGLRNHADLLLLGAGAAGHEFFGESGVHLVLDYHRADLPARLADWAPDAALLLPTVAETYSYTYSELASLGVPVIATRIGALAERIEHGNNGLLVEPTAKAVVARIAEIANDRDVLANIRKTLTATRSITLDTMVAAYRPLLEVGDNARLRYPLRNVDFATMDRAALDTALATAERDLAALRVQLDDAKQLADQRGGWGHALDRELGRSRARIEKLQQEVTERSDWVADIEEQLGRSAEQALLLERDVADRTAWVKDVEDQLARSIEQGASLETDLAARTAWVNDVEDQLSRSIEQAASLEKDLADRTAWVKDVEGQLARSGEHAKSLEKDVADRTAWVADIERQLEASTKRSVTLEAEIKQDRENRAAHVASLESDLDDRTRWAQSLDTEITTLKEKIMLLNERWSEELQRQLEERLAWVRRLEADLVQRETDIAALQKEIDVRTAWAQGLDARVAELEAELQDRTAWALRLDEEVAEQREQLIGLQAEHREQLIGLQALAGEREAILASRSWRATGGFRRFTTWLRRLRLGFGYRRKRATSALARTRGSMARRGLIPTIRRALLELRRTPLQLTPMLEGEPSRLFQPFALPTSKRPRASIVIPVYNKIEYTVACLRSLLEHAGRVPFEVIVVDDGSVDDTPRCLREIDGLRALRNRKNLGFVGSCNAGAAVAKGEFIVFLNNDTVVTAGWLEALLDTFEQVPDVGLVGARLVYPDGRLQEAGGIIFNDGSGWNYGRFGDPRDPRYSFRREVDYCSGAAIAIRRVLFDQLGQFDNRYAPAYYEDTDLAFAVRNAGYKVIYQPAAMVIHFEGITAGTDTGSGVKQYQVVNREKFLAKWADALRQQPEPHPQTPIGIAATHRATRRALIIDATTPAPDQDSGSVRMVNFIRVLIDLGTQVTFMAENRAWIERDTAALQKIGVEVLFHPYVSDPVALFRERGAEFDLILLSRHYIAVNYLELARAYAPQARLLFDTVDLHYLREQREAELADRDDLRRTAAQTRVQEIKMMRDSDITLVVSPVEQELLRVDAPDVRVEILSNVHEVFGCRRPFGERHDLVFVGGFQHPPNIDAVEWFVKAVFPLVRPALAGVRFHIIGSKIIDAVLALAADDVIVHGYVEDIAPFMDDCRISVAPLRYGAGVKGKVNMAMSYGLPVAATPIAVEGMHVRIGEDVLVADDAAGLANEIVRLYSDEALWNQLSANGLANVERHFSFATAREAVLRFLS